jgi:hypothetical protein
LTLLEAPMGNRVKLSTISSLSHPPGESLSLTRQVANAPPRGTKASARSLKWLSQTAESC